MLNPKTAETLDPAAVLYLHRQVSELARGYRTAQVLLTCVELGVFEAVALGAATTDDIAAIIACDPRGTSLLLNTAASLGLLEKQDDYFTNSPLSAICLIRGSAGYMANSLRLERAFYRRWEGLADAVRTGKRPEDNRRDEEIGDWVRNFVFGLYDISKPLAPIIAEALALPDDRPMRVIDVGGCHGAYSLALARRHSQLSGVVFDLPAVAPFAQEIIAESGLSDRVSVQVGDFQRQGLGAGYDLALVFGVLNGELPKSRPLLIRKVYDCLKPGGRIVLRDFVLEDDRTKPLEAALFALHVLLMTESGGLDTHADYARWLVEAGFSPPQTIALPGAVGGALIAADKPTK